MEKEERFGSCELHLPSHQFITEFPTRWRTRGRMIQSVAGRGAGHYPRRGNQTSCSHLARHRCSGVSRKRRSDPSAPRLRPFFPHHASAAPVWNQHLVNISRGWGRAKSSMTILRGFSRGTCLISLPEKNPQDITSPLVLWI